MKTVWLITKRELWSYLRTPSGYVIAAAALLLNGILFNAYAVGSEARLSTEVLKGFFFYASGITMITAIFLSMRLFAEERQTGTIVVLFTAPVRDQHVVAGKFLSALIFLIAVTLLSLYLPALIFVRGKVSFGHIASGYLGLFLMGAASVALGVLGSVLARTQIVAGVLSAFFVVALLLCWMLAKVTDPPLSAIAQYLAFFDEHFTPFQRGLLRLSDVIFYASVTYFALLVSTRSLEGQRWR